jgi:hypothetical protein
MIENMGMQDLTRQMKDSSQRILQAMDWPATTNGSGRRNSAEPEGSTSPNQARHPKQDMEVQNNLIQFIHANKSCTCPLVVVKTMRI